MIKEKIEPNKHVFFSLLKYAASISGSFTEKQKEIVNLFIGRYIGKDTIDFNAVSADNVGTLTKDDVIVNLKSLADEQAVFIMLFQIFLIFSSDGLSEYEQTTLMELVSSVDLSIESIYLFFDIFINNKTDNHNTILTIGADGRADILMQKYNSTGVILKFSDGYLTFFRDLSVGNVNNMVMLNKNLIYDWMLYDISEGDRLELDNKLLTSSDIEGRFNLRNSQDILTYCIKELPSSRQSAQKYEAVCTDNSQDGIARFMIVNGRVSIDKIGQNPILSVYNAGSTMSYSMCSLDDVLYIDKKYKIDLAKNITNLCNKKPLTIENVRFDTVLIGTDPQNNIVIDGVKSAVSLLLQKKEGPQGDSIWELQSVFDNPEVLLNGHSFSGKAHVRTGDVLHIGAHYISFDSDNNLVSHNKNVISSLQFNNLTYYHRNNKTEPALRNLTFSNKSGDFCCVMGPSGAGKSTFVKVLANIFKAPSDDMIYCNGQSLNKNFDLFKEYFSYVAQEDVLFDNLTVYENLFHYGKLKCPNIDNQTLNRKIEEILIKIGLSERKNQIVGSPDRRILSGGERRRLNIALELIADTDIMILDEPTSGLSSYDSDKIIELLSDLAKVGKIIYVVIHQPSREIYLKFSHLLLLDRGGSMAYFGSTKDSFYYFSRYSGSKYPANPDDILSILEEVRKTPDGKIIYETKSKHSRPLRVHSPQQWEHLFSVYRQTYREENDDTDKKKLPDKIKLTFKDKWTQFYHLLARNMTNKFHGKRFMLMSVLMPLCLGGIALFLRDFSGAYHFRDNDQIPKFLFLTGIIIIFLAVSNSINDILNEKYVIRKERLIGYSAVVYFLSKLIAQTIISIYQILIYQTVSFVILGFPILTDIVFFLRMYLFTLVSSVSVITIALMLSAFIGTEKQAFMIIPIFIIPQIVFGGMFINYNEISFKLTPGRPVSEICDVMHARWMFESYIALMQTHEVNNTGVNYFFVDYNLVSDKTGGKSGTKYSTPASVVFTRRVNMMSDPKTRSQYLKQNHNYAMGNVNIFPSVNKLFYAAVIPTYYYNMLVMILFMFICSVIAVIRVKKEK